MCRELLHRVGSRCHRGHGLSRLIGTTETRGGGSLDHMQMAQGRSSTGRGGGNINHRLERWNGSVPSPEPKRTTFKGQGWSVYWNIRGRVESKHFLFEMPSRCLTGDVFAVDRFLAQVLADQSPPSGSATISLGHRPAMARGVIHTVIMSSPPAGRVIRLGETVSTHRIWSQFYS